MPVAASARETKSVKVPSAAQALHVLREGDLRQREADRSFAERSPSALKSAFGQHPLRCEAGEKRRPKNRAGSEAVRGDNFHRLCSGRDMLANSWRARVFGCFCIPYQRDRTMRSLLQNRKHHGFPSALRVGLLAVTLGLAAPALAAGGRRWRWRWRRSRRRGKR
jgi:hypothetical protein